MTTPRGKTVLVVDDEATARKLIGRALERSGYFVILASDGERAMTVLEDNPDIDLLVTDMQMPHKDGRALVSEMMECFKAPPPVIIISGAIKLSEITGLLDIGVKRFMPKPPNIAHLLSYAQDLTDATLAGASAPH